MASGTHRGLGGNPLAYIYDEVQALAWEGVWTACKARQESRAYRHLAFMWHRCHLRAGTLPDPKCTTNTHTSITCNIEYTVREASYTCVLFQHLARVRHLRVRCQDLRHVHTRAQQRTA